MTAAEVALVVAGLAVVAVAAVDLFLAVFNYDGFTFVADRYQRACWRLVVALTSLVPGRARRAARSLGSAGLLPATVALWLAAEISGFALAYRAALGAHQFSLAKGIGPTIGAAFYFSAGAESTLTFGDLVGHSGLTRALVDLQAILGLATFTLALGYVVTTFSVLDDLTSLHATVRRHARHPGYPTSILARHYRGGQPAELTDLLQTLSESLESYDEGLRRYPVVFYFHTRRPERSIPQVFTDLGELLAAVRWGLPAGDPMAADPWLVALLEQYRTTIGRLQRSFVGPERTDAPRPADREAFAAAYRRASGQPAGDDAGVADFVALQERTRQATGLAAPPDDDLDATYDRYVEWLAFDRRTATVLGRVATSLGYGPPRLPAHPGQASVGTG
ncbi:MAG TPA: hypothetical protein VFP61_05930 [Acidimicrobiales bacterium]|nr:hypothetical protein [Acidimicrobiales bacterium]